MIPAAAGYYWRKDPRRGWCVVEVAHHGVEFKIEDAFVNWPGWDEHEDLASTDPDSWGPHIPDLMEGPDRAIWGGLNAMAHERVRQLLQKGFTLDHDRAEHPDGQLSRAAAIYALGEAAYWRQFGEAPVWPWEWDRIEKITAMPVRERLAKAGALIAAELDRLGPQP